MNSISHDVFPPGKARLATRTTAGASPGRGAVNFLAHDMFPPVKARLAARMMAGPPPAAEP